MPKEVIHIREPYYTAGRIFQWTARHQSIGIGLRKDYIDQKEDDDLIYVQIGQKKDVWSVTKRGIIKVIKQYHSIQEADNRVLLYIIPWDIMTKEKNQ